MFDLLLKGGPVIDPSQGLNKQLDLAINGNRISQLAPSIPESEASQVVDTTGKIVAPGLIDIHTHVYHPGRNINHPDMAGVRAGVTTMVDAGGSGSGNFQDFCDIVLPQAQTRVYSFLSIFQDRTIQSSPTEFELDVEGVVRVARENPDLVKGIKVIVSPRTVQAVGLKHVEAAKAAAREAGLRVMMHIGDIGPKHQIATSPETVAKAVSMLGSGDMVTHIFTPLTGAALDGEGNLLPHLIEAQQRGVFMDTAYGDFNFGWERADAVLDQGLIPDTIATDVEIHAGDGTRKLSERGLIEYTAFFLKLGFSLEEVVRMTTTTPAQFLGIYDVVGGLKEGREADVSVLELIKGKWHLADATGESRVGTEALIPVATIKAGQMISLGDAPHPWGWAPPTAAVKVL